METRKISTYIIGFGLLFTSCVKDDLYNTPHPAQGAVKVTTDWTIHSSEATLPESYHLRVGETQQAVTEKTNVFASRLNPGKYDLLAYNTPQGMTITAGTASVNLKGDGTLEPLPDYLFMATGRLDVMADDTLHIALLMRQRTRMLILTLALTEGDDLLIAGTTATLTGIAPQVNLLTGELTGERGLSIAPDFSITTENGKARADAASTLAATLRLLGVRADEKQLFTLRITMTNGQVQTVETDLTELLKDFDTSTDPIHLDARLNLLVEASVNSTITGWIVIKGESSEAN